MKKIFTHKILPVLAIFMFVVFTLCTSCFAISYPDNTETLIEENSMLPSGKQRYYIIGQNYLGDTFLINSTSLSFKITQTRFGSKQELLYGVLIVPHPNFNLDTIAFKLVDGSWDRVYVLDSTISSDWASSKTLTFATSQSDIFTNSDLTSYGDNIFYCNTPFNELGVTEKVFQVPVVGKQTVLAPVMTETTQQGTTLQAEIQTKTLAEILGILPIVMIIIVSLIGLRKALKLLRTLLRSA